MSEDMNKIFELMGSAMTRWSIADRGLTALYAITVSPTSPGIAAASIWRVISHRQKMDMIDSALKALFLTFPDSDSDAVSQEWKILTKLANKASKGRNDLGHASFYTSGSMPESEVFLKKDRDIFWDNLNGSDDARNFSATDCIEIESDCFRTCLQVVDTLKEVRRFYQSLDIEVKLEQAVPKHP